ncbi:recombinase RecJ [Halorhabdus sp. BNX81]|uniref:recombinase RecJ n=1 Tax=Halorhabdus sp. BNX81 TaxID=2980181 RepID=UPI0023DCF154|nr:recombinase RecJ [Halorhabdus sp. BNX81]WEL20929.1 Exonuclease-like protein Recj [Halorhabdus sp. BNX81]
MSTTGRQSGDGAHDAASSLREAGLVHLAPAATGDAIAATGVLARALDAVDVPFQISVVQTPADAARATEADRTVALGRASPDADRTLGSGRPASVAAFEVARSLDATITESADVATLAATGVVGAGEEPTDPIAEALEEADIERRPGAAVPTADLADGLAHSTLVHAPFSGDPEAARATLTEHDAADPGDDEARRRTASVVALTAVDAADADTRAAMAVEDVLRPYAGGPFETVGGYADVLDAAVREQPGVAIALALGHDAVSEAALSAWRTHAERAHDAVRDATVRRHAGLVVADVDGPASTVARLLRDFRSPEPLALVADGDRAVLAAVPEYDARATLESATASIEHTGDVIGDADRAHLTVSGATETLVAAVREVTADA